MSKLDSVSVSPKPIERQSVQTCLKVFCDRTVAALKTHPKMTKKNVKGTVLFVEKVISFWKIVNVKSPGEDIRLKDSLRDVIKSLDDPALVYLQEFAEMAKFMTPVGKRVKQLTRDTSKAIMHNCQGLIELVNYLLSSGLHYVILGWFRTDPLEKCFSKLRQGSGGTYFIDAKSVIEKVNIQHAKLCLRLDVEITGIDGHTCNFCEKELTDEEFEYYKNLIDALADLEEFVNKETLMAIVYIGGYIQKCEKESFDDTLLYYQEYGAYLKSLNRGGLQIPSDNIVQWVIFCHIFFKEIPSGKCRKFHIKMFLFIADNYSFEVTKKQCQVLSNILMKNFAVINTPSSTKEKCLKVIKLS